VTSTVVKEVLTDTSFPGSLQQRYCLCWDLVRPHGLAELVLVRPCMFSEMLWQLVTHQAALLHVGHYPAMTLLVSLMGCKRVCSWFYGS